MRVDELVERILRDGPGPADVHLKDLLRTVSEAGRKMETGRCDLKRGFEPSDASWPYLVKDTVAMANSGGGVLVLGVDDNGARHGLGQSLLRDLDPVKVNAKLEAKAPGGRLDTGYYEVSFYRRRYGFLAVQSNDALIVFDREWGFNPAGEKRQRTVIYPGVIYVRGVAETRPARQADLARIVQRLTEAGSQKFLARIEKLAAVPLSAELIAYDPASGGQGVRLVARGEGQPVTIVDEQPGAVPIHEVLSPDVPFSSAQAEFTSQLRHWRTSDPNHRVRRETLAGWYLRREELDISDDMAEFAFLSAGDNHGFVMFWAGAMTEEHLNAVLEAELLKAGYPMRQVMPYVVAAFCWSRRRALLEPRLKAFEGSRGVAERIISSRSFQRFTRQGRYPGRTVRFGGYEYGLDFLAEDRDEAQSLFDEVLTADREGKLRDRGATHQLDILLHARES